MKTFKYIIFIAPLLMLLGCKQSGKNKNSEDQESTETTERFETTKTEPSDTADSDEEVIFHGDSIGVGPIEEVEMDDQIDESMAEEGKELFGNNCASCHRIHEKSVGPALGNVLERRSPAFVMNMVLNTKEMLEEDPTAKSLLAEYETDMVEVDLTEDEVRTIVEYLRTEQ